MEVSLFETDYVLPFPGRFPWLKKKLGPILRKTPESWGNLIYILFLPSVNVGSTSEVNVGVCYLFAIFSAR